MDDKSVIEVAAHELLQLHKPRIWMTARALSSGIRSKYPNLRNLSQVQLFDILVAHASSKPRRIRNSPYPSAETLEVLWASIELAGEREVDPPILIADGAEANLKVDFSPLNPVNTEINEVIESMPRGFISYNFNDTKTVKKIVPLLESKKYSIWMAGAKIAAGEVINSRVRDAIKNAKEQFLFLSDYSLKSLWVSKEILVGEGMKLPCTLIVNGDDKDLVGLVHHWLCGGQSSTFGKIQNYVGPSLPVARQFLELLKRHCRNEKNIIYTFYASREIKELHPRLQNLDKISDANDK